MKKNIFFTKNKFGKKVFYKKIIGKYYFLDLFELGHTSPLLWKQWIVSSPMGFYWPNSRNSTKMFTEGQTQNK